MKTAVISIQKASPSKKNSKFFQQNTKSKCFISKHDQMVNNNKVTINAVLLSRGKRKKEKHVERRKESSKDLETQKKKPSQSKLRC
jgi:hypothetical protein